MIDILDDEVNLLRQSARSVVRELGLLNDAYFDIGVTLAERHLLIELTSCLYPTVGDIAERLLLDKSTASRLIARAVKKGYIACCSDGKDKRKKFIQFTEKGKSVLNVFEPIAFNQTKEALQTLTDEEIETVYKGVALYAKGLKQSRLKQNIVIMPMTSQDHVELAQLITEMQKERCAWNSLFEGDQESRFPYFIMKMDSKIIGGIGVSPFQASDSLTCELKGLCLHFDVRCVGFEKMLLDFCIKEAKKLNYQRCCIDLEKETAFSSCFFEKQGFQFGKNDDKRSLLWKPC